MRQLGLVTLLVCLISGTANADVSVFYSSSGSSANAGTVFNIALGDTGSIYVWVANNEVNAVDGLGLDFISGNAAVLQASSFAIQQPAGRWSAVMLGSSGDLVTESNALSLGPFLGATGITTGQTVLHGTITFAATAVGTTNLSITENASKVSAGGIPSQLNFGTATVNVTQAIPEPGTAVVGLIAVGAVVVRRRRR